MHQTQDLIREVAQVAEAAVVAVPHPKWNERPLLIVVPVQGSHLAASDTLSFLKVAAAAAIALVSAGAGGSTIDSLNSILCCSLGISFCLCYYMGTWLMMNCLFVDL